MGRTRTAAGGLGLALAISATSTCSSPQHERAFLGLAPLVTISAPHPAPGDETLALTDQQVGASHGWFCTEERPPLTFEWMFEDADVRSIGAVAMVLGNLDPAGLGTVTVRVQRGHGVRARATGFEANIPRVAEGGSVVVVFPHAVTGDHVLLEIPSRSRRVGAVCLAEFAVFRDGVLAVANVRPDAQVDARDATEPGESSSPPPSGLVDGGVGPHDP